ncbi:MAG: type II toxin-antitoxin system RelE/ParE family toxin [Planctomycetia bacterium]|jgi:toxin ParE1/3/4|nr:type II toxin-antitoxin system RelE/ParE family toxin [Planctomycetia bacterium]
MRVFWTGRAAADLQAIRDYIASDSEFYASRFVDRLFRSTGVLRKFPEIGQIVAEFAPEEIRELTFQGYRILYRTRNRQVEILAVVHGGRDLASLDPRPWEDS